MEMSKSDSPPIRIVMMLDTITVRARGSRFGFFWMARCLINRPMIIPKALIAMQNMAISVQSTPLRSNLMWKYNGGIYLKCRGFTDSSILGQTLGSKLPHITPNTSFIVMFAVFILELVSNEPPQP
jgi:hypothetical protein